MTRFIDAGFGAGFGADRFAVSFGAASPQEELLLECHRASRLLQRLQIHKGRSMRHEGMMGAPRMPVGPVMDEPVRPGPLPPPPFAQMIAAMHGQGRLLHLLLEKDGLLIKDIVMAFDIRPSSASELVAKLEKQGLVRVESDPDDKRARKVFLTEEGQALASRMKTTAGDNTNELLSVLSAEEQEQLLNLLKKLNGSLAEQSEKLSQEAEKRQRHPGARMDRRAARHDHPEQPAPGAEEQQ